MMKETYDKPPITISKQLDILEGKGMTIANMALARHVLETIGYYRFTGYAYTFRDTADHSSYIDGTTFEQVLNLYEFDRKMKHILFSYIERIEIAFRAKVIDVMSIGYGNGQWFTDDSLFSNSIEHLDFLNKMKDDVDGSMEEFMRHFREKYSDEFPPAWITLQICPFGRLVKLYQNIEDTEKQDSIARFFGCDSTDRFMSWINSLAYLRNICGHHSRLWNLAIQKKPRIFIFGDRNRRRDNGKLYFLICIMKKLLQPIIPNDTMESELAKLFAEFPFANKRKSTFLGFPDDWRDDKGVWV
jgi:abortive infection bacteriophage resistance protein